MSDQNIDDDEVNSQRLNAQQIEFLQNRSPDDWHRYAWHYNWDERLDTLFWIVSQPDCDRATALLVFWKGCPTAYDYETEEGPMGDDPYSVAPMLRYISERFNTTGYRRAEISYDFRKDHGLNMDEYDPDDKEKYIASDRHSRLRDIDELIDRQKDVHDPKVQLHADMKLLSSPGRTVGGYDDDSDFNNSFCADADHSGTVPDAAVEASARIRAIRHLANANIDYRSASEGVTISPKPVTSLPAGSMDDAWIEAIGLFASMCAFGVAIALAANASSGRVTSLLFWAAVIAAICYCLYQAISDLRGLQLAVQQQGFQLSSGWIKFTTTLAFLTGIALGREGALRLLEPDVTLLARTSIAAIGVVVIVATTLIFARMLIHPRALRAG